WIHIIIILAWIGFLVVPVQTVRHYRIDNQPPLGDNIAWQISALEITRSVFDSDLKPFVELAGSNNPIGYIACLAFSFFAWGFNAVSSYIVSVLFGAAFLIVTYLLAIELGARPWVAFASVIFMSLLPNFLYQNFLQTNNDYPAAT